MTSSPASCGRGDLGVARRAELALADQEPCARDRRLRRAHLRERRLAPARAAAPMLTAAARACSALAVACALAASVWWVSSAALACVWSMLEAATSCGRVASRLAWRSAASRWPQRLGLRPRRLLAGARGHPEPLARP